MAGGAPLLFVGTNKSFVCMNGTFVCMNETNHLFVGRNETNVPSPKQMFHPTIKCSIPTEQFAAEI
jgi:hypothetical protein